MHANKEELVYEGANFLRQRLVLSCLSGRKLRINSIKITDELNIGIAEHEMSMIRLIDKISNGSKIEVNRMGTSFLFIPGILVGDSITHDCNNSRGIAYYLEPLMMLAPFCKRPLNVKLTGITNCEGDLSVDLLRYSHFQLLRKFLATDDGSKLTVIKRGLPPLGGGVVHFTCPVRKELKPFQWLDAGLVKKVRGISFTRKVQPILGNRIIEAAKRHLNQYLTDVYFTCDNSKGPAPGFGISINCVTTKGSHYVSESVSCFPIKSTSEPQTDEVNTKPIKSAEQVGEEAAFRLLEQIKRGGCVDSYCQCLILLFMTLGPKDVCKVMTGPLTTQAMYMLKHIKDFFSIVFKIDEHKPDFLDLNDDDEDDEETERKTGDSKLILTCVGTGFVNFSKGNI